MAIRITCPACQAANTIDDDKRGRKVRCRKCEKILNVPEGGAKKKPESDAAFQEGRKVKPSAAGPRNRRDEDSDDRPTSGKKRQPAQSGFPVMLLVVGGGAAFVLFLLL